MSIFSAITSPIGIAAGALGLNFLGNRYLQDRNMDFQQNMSSTQYQRAMADMEAAGLNPMLAGQVNGNSAGSGAASSISTSLASDYINSAKMAAKLDKEVDLLDAQINTAKSQEYKNLSEGDRNYKLNDKMNEEILNIIEDRKVITNSAKNLDLTNRTGEARLYGILNEAGIDKTKAGEFLRWINRVSEALQGSRNATRGINLKRKR